MKKRVAAIVAIGLSVLAMAACPDFSSLTSPSTSSSGSAGFDGTYNFFFKYPSPNGLASSNLSRFLIITNGVISSTDNTVSGSVDHFGAVVFHSPCPINSSTATWTGNMNSSALSGSNFGQGTYTCSIAIGGGSSDSWQATQAP